METIAIPMPLKNFKYINALKKTAAGKGHRRRALSAARPAVFAEA
jgi:hypothetical protein